VRRIRGSFDQAQVLALVHRTPRRLQLAVEVEEGVGLMAQWLQVRHRLLRVVRVDPRVRAGSIYDRLILRVALALLGCLRSGTPN